MPWPPERSYSRRGSYTSLGYHTPQQKEAAKRNRKAWFDIAQRELEDYKVQNEGRLIMLHEKPTRDEQLQADIAAMRLPALEGLMQDSLKTGRDINNIVKTWSRNLHFVRKEFMERWGPISTREMEAFTAAKAFAEGYFCYWLEPQPPFTRIG